MELSEFYSVCKYLETILGTYEGFSPEVALSRLHAEQIKLASSPHVNLRGSRWFGSLEPFFQRPLPVDWTPGQREAYDLVRADSYVGNEARDTYYALVAIRDSASRRAQLDQYRKQVEAFIGRVKLLRKGLDDFDVATTDVSTTTLRFVLDAKAQPNTIGSLTSELKEVETILTLLARATGAGEESFEIRRIGNGSLWFEIFVQSVGLVGALMAIVQGFFALKDRRMKHLASRAGLPLAMLNSPQAMAAFDDAAELDQCALIEETVETVTIQYGRGPEPHECRQVVRATVTRTHLFMERGGRIIPAGGPAVREALGGGDAVRGLLEGFERMLEHERAEPELLQLTSEEE